MQEHSKMESNIIERVKSIQDAIDIANPSQDIRNLINYQGTDRKMIGAKNFCLAELLAEVLNEGWVSKGFGWFGHFNPGSGFYNGDYSYYHRWYYHVSLRLLFKEKALFLHATRICPEVYKEYTLK